MQQGKFGHAVFALQKKAYCVWGWDLREENLKFFRSVDHEYFDYQARVHSQELGGEEWQRAAMALRGAYNHGLETFFTLVGAALQAPHIVPAWILKAQPGVVRELVEDIHKGNKTPNLLHIADMSWEAVAAALLTGYHPDPAECARAEGKFAKLWRRFARDFLQEFNRVEYNSYKHGVRAKAGAGFRILVGKPGADGKPPTPDEMVPVGGAEEAAAGCSFFNLRPIDGAPKTSEDPHLRLVRQSVNWNPAGSGAGLRLLGVSILNVVSGLRVRFGDPTRPILFGAPELDVQFDAPWANAPSVNQLTTEIPVREADIKRFSRKELGQILRQYRPVTTPPNSEEFAV